MRQYSFCVMLILFLFCGAEAMGHGIYPFQELRQKMNEYQIKRDTASLEEALRLASQRDPKGAEALITLLHSKFDIIRSKAAAGLGQTGEERAVIPLLGKRKVVATVKRPLADGFQSAYRGCPAKPRALFSPLHGSE